MYSDEENTKKKRIRKYTKEIKKGVKKKVMDKNREIISLEGE